MCIWTSPYIQPSYLGTAKILQEVEEARIAIRDSKGMVIDGRPVRVEHAKGERGSHK